MNHDPSPARATTVAPLKLTISDVHKSYETTSKHTFALAPVNMEIGAGEFVVFVGPSGCGKSTLLNMIAGLIHPTGGRIALGDREVTRPGHDRLMMFQEPALFPWLTVLDNVAFGVPRQWLRPSARKKTAREFLRMMHLEKFEKSAVHELSGGMKQRIALARALAANPRILLIDEPFTALDVMVKQELYGELQRIHRETGKTIIFVTHELQEAACLGDRVFVFSGSPGRVTHELKIDLPRPRNFDDPQVVAHAAALKASLKENHEAQARENPA